MRRVQLYMSYRDGDATGLALNITRELRGSAEFELVRGLVGTGAPPPVPRGALILLLIGRRWLGADEKARPPLSDTGDPQRKLLEKAIADRARIVPVLFEVPLRDWSALCARLPPSLKPISLLNACEIRAQSFSSDLRAMLAGLSAPERPQHWAEAAPRTLIRIETAGSGPLDWWTGRDKTLRVLIDGMEIGALTGWNGRFEAEVEPGRHTVQIREGAVFKSGIVDATVNRGGAATLVCHRNGFTGGISLASKG
ncbi:MAG: hypothetical protein ACRD1U_03990 [Vicinamibacterales bacterium]